MIFRSTILIIATTIAFLIGLKNQSTSFFGLESFYIYPLTTFIISFLIILIEISSHEISGRKLLFSSIGLSLGLIIGFFVGNIFVNSIPGFSIKFQYIFQILFGYVGFTLSWLKEQEIKLGTNYTSPNSHNKININHKILDTSVIIDGRIADITETGFLEGVLVVPKFVLNELHQVADSSDPLKRSRGRRGLDILNHMKASKKTIIRITEEDFLDIPEVDSKLLKLARNYSNSAIVTNDFNLNKVAEFQDVCILNINELANAIKPVLLPNEEIRITVIKEGKDQNQGIAYLDDGTMIVVDNGKNYIGQQINVLVTSILQTPAGRMIFTQINREK